MYTSKLRATQLVPPDEAGYERELRALVSQLDEGLPSESRVLVMSPPPSGRAALKARHGKEESVSRKSAGLCANTV